jgi:hypothetical protein
MTIDHWKSRIDTQFDAGLFKQVLINGNRRTHEISNFEYCLVPQQLKELVPAPVKEEIEERDFVVSKSLEMYTKYLSQDMSSRQGAFVNNYDGADNHCISYFHHYVRDEKYSMNVYVRSMDYERNFVFDCQTFNLAYRKVFDKLKAQYGEHVASGYIRVFVFSLHIYV